MFIVNVVHSFRCLRIVNVVVIYEFTRSYGYIILLLVNVVHRNELQQHSSSVGLLMQF